jgi:hypothetical protein
MHKFKRGTARSLNLNLRSLDPPVLHDSNLMRGYWLSGVATGFSSFLSYLELLAACINGAYQLSGCKHNVYNNGETNHICLLKRII